MHRSLKTPGVILYAMQVFAILRILRVLSDLPVFKKIFWIAVDLREPLSVMFSAFFVYMFVSAALGYQIFGGLICRR